MKNPNQDIDFLILRFKNHLAEEEVIHFRKVFSKNYGEISDLLHNHQSAEFVIYRYPLFQYKIIDSKIVIVALGGAVKVLDKIIEEGFDILEMGQVKDEFNIQSLKRGIFSFELRSSVFHYRLSNWLALNSKNYQLFQDAVFMEEQVAILKKVLIGNILSAAKGLNYRVDSGLWVDIQAIERVKLIRNKSQKMQAFDIVFSANIKLPTSLSLGKSCSVGFGVLNELQHT